MATRAHTVPRFYLNGFVAPESSGAADPFVWLCSLTTGEIKKRAPKNISISQGLYDGPGGLEHTDALIETHLAKIESSASKAIRQFVATRPSGGANPAPEVWRFLAWQAARTPGWFDLVQKWVNEWNPDAIGDVLEPPPNGFENVKDRNRKHWVENPRSGERLEVEDSDQIQSYRKLGWNWILSRDDQLELLHLQAWYFQVRHFPRLSWVRLDAPDGESFITSDETIHFTRSHVKWRCLVPPNQSSFCC